MLYVYASEDHVAALYEQGRPKHRAYAEVAVAARGPGRKVRDGDCALLNRDVEGGRLGGVDCGELGELWA